MILIARKWAENHDAKTILMESDRHCEKVIEDVSCRISGLTKREYGIRFYTPKSRIEQSLLQSRNFIRHPDLVVYTLKDGRIRWFIEVSGSTEYTLFPPNDACLKQSKILHVEADKVEAFNKGYYGIHVQYSYVFADDEIRYTADWTDFYDVREETVFSCGKQENSRNYLLDLDKLMSFNEAWAKMVLLSHIRV